MSMPVPLAGLQLTLLLLDHGLISGRAATEIQFIPILELLCTYVRMCVGKGVSVCVLAS